MELQLGLALPDTPVNDFDLNCYVTDPKDPAPPEPCGRGDDMVCGSRSCRKRGFLEAFDPPPRPPLRTLPLLLWNSHTNDDDCDDRREGVEIASSSLAKSGNDDGNCIVGWPPIKSRRKKASPDNDDEIGGAGAGGNQNSRYVKVNMEGVGIARKIDLSRHKSYHALTTTLIDMFDKCKLHARPQQHVGVLNEANKIFRALNSRTRTETGTGCLQEMYPGGHLFSRCNA